MEHSSQNVAAGVERHPLMWKPLALLCAVVIYVVAMVLFILAPLLTLFGLVKIEYRQQ